MIIKSRIAVRFFAPLNWGDVVSALAGHKIVVQIPPARLFSIEVDEAEADIILAELRNNSLVSSADFEETTSFCDYTIQRNNCYEPMLSQQWAIRRMNVLAAHTFQKGSPNILVAYVDSGLYAAHDEFRDRGITGLGPNGGDWEDFGTENPHGTAVASCISANSTNGIGVVGVAPNITLFPIKIKATAAGEMAWTDLIYALWQAVGVSPDVLSLSLSMPSNISWSSDLAAALTACTDDGGVVCIAAGNQNVGDEYPLVTGNPAATLHVASLNEEESRSYFSNLQSSISSIAPGSQILMASNDGDYLVAGGTSMACPHTAALLGLIRSENPALTGVEAKSVITQTDDMVLSLDPFLWGSVVGVPNALKSVLKARSLKTENANSIYPYVQVFGDHPLSLISIMENTKWLENRFLVEVGVYGQNWTGGGTIQVFTGQTLLYSGPPLLMRRLTMPKFDNLDTAAKIMARATPSMLFNAELRDGSTFFTFDFTGMKYFVIQSDDWILEYENIEVKIDGVLKANLYRPEGEEETNGASFGRVRLIDVEEIEGAKTVEFIRNIERGNFYLQNLYMTTSEPFTTGLELSDITAPLTIIATDGLLTETVRWNVDELSPTTSLCDKNTGSYSAGTLITLIPGFDIESPPVTIFYRWDVDAWQEYTSPIAMQEGLFEWYGEDTSGNSEPTQSREYEITLSSLFNSDLTAATLLNADSTLTELYDSTGERIY